jgi:hypothetical protein
MKIFDKLFFIGPMGLGDNFVLNGMVHYFGDRCNELHLPTQSKFFKTIETLYQDYPNIKVVLIPNDLVQEEQYVKENNLSRILRVPLVQSKIRNYQLIPMWDIQLYSNYEVSFGLRYSNFRLPKHINGSEELYQTLSNGEPYVLVHRFTGDSIQGLPIDINSFRKSNNLPDIRVIDINETITDDMMQYIKLIQHAEEVHCVASSFHCLVDSVKTNARLFFHDAREKTSMAVNTQWNENRWIIVNYHERF